MSDRMDSQPYDYGEFSSKQLHMGGHGYAGTVAVDWSDKTSQQPSRLPSPLAANFTSQGYYQPDDPEGRNDQFHHDLGGVGRRLAHAPRPPAPRAPTQDEISNESLRSDTNTYENSANTSYRSSMHNSSQLPYNPGYLTGAYGSTPTTPTTQSYLRQAGLHGNSTAVSYSHSQPPFHHNVPYHHLYANLPQIGHPQTSNTWPHPQRSFSYQTNQTTNAAQQHPKIPGANHSRNRPSQFKHSHLGQQSANPFQQTRQTVSAQGENDEDDSDGDLASIADDGGFQSSWTVNTIEEARQKAFPREPLQVENDDWKTAKRSRLVRKQWVQRIVTALRQPYKALPAPRKNGTAYTEEEKAEWRHWQSDAKLRTDEILEDKELVDEDVAAAFLLVEEVLVTHEKGLRRTTYSGDDTTKFSARMAKIKRVVTDLAVVRFDVLEVKGLHELAANPDGYAKRKVNNLRVNYGKQTCPQARLGLV